MSKDDQNIKFVVPLIISVVACVLFCWLSTKFDIGNHLSIIGSIASLFGLWLAYKQIQTIKDITSKTNEAVQSKLKYLNGFLTMADMTRIISSTKEILGYLSSSKMELALLRMRDLRTELVQLRQNKQILGSNDVLLSLNKCVSTLGIDIGNINDSIMKNRSISLETVTSNMDYLLAVLSEIEGKLKYKEYDKSN